jgi:DnaA family protein
MRQLVLEIAPERTFSLANFVVGTNQELLTHLHALARGEFREAVLYLWGAVGSGRSHLLHALRQSSASALYIVDDVETLDAEAQGALFQAINAAREGGPTVLAAGLQPPAQLQLREDVRSRLAWGLVYEVQALDDAARITYLEQEAARRGTHISSDVIRYLLNHVRRDLPTLVALMEHLDRYSLAQRRPLTIPFVREALEQMH